MGDLLETYPRLGDKITTARQAGYSDEEIQGHLQHKMQMAFKAGYSPEEVNAYLGQVEQPSIMEPIVGTAKALGGIAAEVPGALVDMAKSVGKAAITPPEEGMFDISHAPERLLDVAKGLASGATAGIYQPEATNEAQAARQTLGNLAGYALPFGAAVKGAEALGAGRLASEVIAGAATGAAAPAVRGEPTEAAKGAVTGGVLGGAFNVASRIFKSFYDRAPKDVAEVRQAYKTEPVFADALAEELGAEKPSAPEPAFIKSEQPEVVNNEPPVEAKPAEMPEQPKAAEPTPPPDMVLNAEPRFEKTAAGDQAVIPGSPIEREIPSGGLKAERPQTEAPTDLERASVPDTQENLLKPKSRQVLEDSEVRPSTFIQRQGGIKIPKELKEEFGGWNRLNNKNGLPADEMAELMYQHGLIEEPTTNALLDALKNRTKSARGTDIVAAQTQADIDAHVKGLQQSETGLEYKGHDYDSVVPEGPNKFRLKDDPDKIIPRSKVVEVEEKVPFDIPEDPVQERIKALEAENAKLQKKVQPAKVEGEASAGTENVPAKDRFENAVKLGEAQRAQEEAQAQAEMQRGSITIPGMKQEGLPGVKASTVSNAYLERDINARDLTRSTIREFAGDRFRRQAQFEEAMKTEIDRWDSADIRSSLKFIDDIEHGNEQVNPQDQALANKLRDALDQRRKRVQALGTGKLENWIENYFPHLWAKPDEASRLISRIMGRRPLEGPASFLKRRTIPTTVDGINAGLTPITYNPVKLALLKINEMDRYIMAHNIKN